jgi:hypothetical protein
MIGFRRGLYGSAAAFRIPLPANRGERQRADYPHQVAGEAEASARKAADLAVRSAVLKEVEMLLHLPTVVLAMLSPIVISDTLPKFDIAKECRFESESSQAFGRCSHDEADALQRLETEWPQFVGADRNACFTEATVGGFASYVELLICLEMARDVRNENTHPRDPSRVQSTNSAPPEMSVVDKHE